MRAVFMTICIVWVLFITGSVLHLLVQLQYRTASDEQVSQINNNTVSIATLIGQVDTMQKHGTEELQELLEQGNIQAVCPPVP